ncbi:hypothetical protein GCM10018787_18260 [Streptomyces thermodiastaticus]|nr:hypothetical protein GCM10018787_18260 [Streptomyces thermodiastaticus]
MPVPVTHVTPMRRDALHDHRAQQAVLPVTAPDEDGGTRETVLVPTPAQVEAYSLQWAQLVDARQSALQRAR